MPRITNSPASRRRRKRVLDQAKGFRGSRSKHFTQAVAAVNRAMSMATVHRKLKKRQYRQLWIGRVNAAARAQGMTYSRLVEGLTKAGIALNRKMLSEIAIHDSKGFEAIVARARAALA
ncbi:MAG: 50S ribosomal protein L20 [Kiritimatiellae bacterium]|nr:50S ribosomal protein L20 [Kiritimatiellia bacterium]